MLDREFEGLFDMIELKLTIVVPDIDGVLEVLTQEERETDGVGGVDSEIVARAVFDTDIEKRGDSDGVCVFETDDDM